MTWARRFTERREQREAEKAANLKALCLPSRSLHRGTYAGGTAAADPKSEPYRDPVLLEMARGRFCLLDDPVICDHARQPEDTVAAHSNLGRHGKAGARKADDCYSAWLCFCAHSWLDQGKASAQEKERRFVLAHANQVMAWRLIAMDPGEPERFRKAAQRALERLNATPIGEKA
jgi:hypothetical protein